MAADSRQHIKDVILQTSLPSAVEIAASLSTIFRYKHTYSVCVSLCCCNVTVCQSATLTYSKTSRCSRVYKVQQCVVHIYCVLPVLMYDIVLADM